MADKKQIAVRTCGGCGCDFDRRGVINEIKKAYEATCDFKFSYAVDQDSDFDLVLLINGCDSACAPASTIDSVVVIDHTNHENAVEVFGGAAVV